MSDWGRAAGDHDPTFMAAGGLYYSNGRLLECTCLRPATLRLHSSRSGDNPDPKATSLFAQLSSMSRGLPPGVIWRPIIIALRAWRGQDRLGTIPPGAGAAKRDLVTEPAFRNNYACICTPPQASIPLQARVAFTMR